MNFQIPRGNESLVAQDDEVLVSIHFVFILALLNYDLSVLSQA